VSTPESPPRPAGPRDIYYFTHPERWPAWPFLPVVRRHAGGATDCGLLYDFRGTGGPTGFRSTVFVGLCGTPHKPTYADRLIRRTLLDVL